VKRETAEKIVDAANRIDDILEELGGISWEIEDEPERHKIRRGIGECIHTLYYHVTREAVREYPDLHPDFQPGNQPDPS
jgi:hypothetical protein